MNDFKFYPPGLDEGTSHEHSYYSHTAATISKHKERETEKKTDITKARNNDTVRNTALNHRISMCCVIFGYEEDELKIMLLESNVAAEINDNPTRLELPGGLATENQTLETSARHMVRDLSGTDSFFIEQVYSFGNPGKTGESDDVSQGPWEITVAFFALLNADSANLNPVFGAKRAKWYSLKQVRSLSPYQDRIVAKALATLRFEIRHFPIAFELLPQKFTMAQVQSLYQAISGKKLDKRNFIKKLKALNLLLPTGEKQKNVIARPSELFVFNRDAYKDSDNGLI